MITNDVLKFVFDTLSESDIESVMESNKDYVLLELHHFNSGSISRVEAHDYSEEIDEQAQSDGQVFCDKDTFLQLFSESESINPFLIDWI